MIVNYEQKWCIILVRKGASPRRLLWASTSPKKPADTFNLNYNDMEVRHHLNQVTYEEGKLTLDEYLTRVVFYEKRNFTPDQFREFMFTQTDPFMI